MKNKVPKSSQKTLGIWLVLIVLAIFFAQQMSLRHKEIIKEFSYPQFVEALEKNKSSR